MVGSFGLRCFSTISPGPTALLKDADGLDRVRLGDLDPRYLRHPESKGMVDFAQTLFDATDGVIATGPAHFEQLLAAAKRLL